MVNLTNTRPLVRSASVPSNAPRAWNWLHQSLGITSSIRPLNTFPGNALNKNPPFQTRFAGAVNEFCPKRSRIILSFSVIKSHHRCERKRGTAIGHLDAELIEWHNHRLELLLLFVLSRTELYAIQLINLKQRYFRHLLESKEIFAWFRLKVRKFHCGFWCLVFVRECLMLFGKGSNSS